MNIALALDIEQIKSEIRSQIAEKITDQYSEYTMLYGEVCTRETAARVLSVTPNTVSAMLRDGRIAPACGGTRVNVRSMVDYIRDRGGKDHQMRVEKKKARQGRTA